MRVFKDDCMEVNLGNLSKGDLFEKDCNNPCTTYMVASPDGSRNFCCEVIKDADKHTIVVDLRNAVIKALPSKTLVIPLETDGLTVRETA